MKIITFAVMTILILGISSPILANASNNVSTANDTSQLANLTTKLNVVTSVSPITNIVKNIGGDRVDLVGIIPEGLDSHTFELVPSDIVKMSDADLVIIDGLNLEGGMEKVANEANVLKFIFQI